MPGMEVWDVHTFGDAEFWGGESVVGLCSLRFVTGVGARFGPACGFLCHSGGPGESQEKGRLHCDLGQDNSHLTTCFTSQEPLSPSVGRKITSGA